MKQNGTKKLFIIVMLIAIVVLLADNVSATDLNRLQLTPTNQTSNTTTNTANTTANTTTNTTTNTTRNTVTPTLNQNRVTNNAGSSYNNQNLPQTGVVDDIAVTALVAICTVFAIFTYKKIRDYKNL